MSHRHREEIGEQRFDDAAERRDELIARRVEHREMEFHIRHIPRRFVADRLGHRLVGGLDLGDLHGRAMGCRERGRLGLDHHADLLHVSGEALEINGGAIPAQHVAIEQVPDAARLDARADLGARLDQPLGRQHLHRFPDRGAADFVDLAAFGLIGQKGARLVVAPDDPLAQIMISIYGGTLKRRDGASLEGPGLAALAAGKAPAEAKKLDGLMADAEKKLGAIRDRAESGKESYDQMIGQDNPEGNALIQTGIDALVAQTRGIEAAVAALNLKITVEGSDSLDNPSAVQ